MPRAYGGTESWRVVTALHVRLLKSVASTTVWTLASTVEGLLWLQGLLGVFSSASMSRGQGPGQTEVVAGASGVHTLGRGGQL